MAARPRSTPTARAALARESRLAPPRASLPNASITSGRTCTKASITWSLVSVNLPLTELPAREMVPLKPVLNIARQIDVHHAVGRADLDLRVVVAGGAHQRVQRFRPADLDQRLHRFHAHVDIGIAHIGTELRDPVFALLGQIAHRARALLGVGILRLQKREERRETEKETWFHRTNST